MNRLPSASLGRREAHLAPMPSLTANSLAIAAGKAVYLLASSRTTIEQKSALTRVRTPSRRA